MRLIEYELYIKSLVKKNKEDPEIYDRLQEMILIFLKRKKACRCIKDYEDISYLLAGDIFMEIVNGVEINYYLGYLNKKYKSYIKSYYLDNSSETLSYYDITDVEEAFNEASYDYNCINNKIYLEEINKIIERTMYDSCKYDPTSPAFLNLKLSLILTLLRGEPTTFHLKPEQVFYLRLIKTNFTNQVLKDMNE